MRSGISIGEQIQIQNALMAELITACLGDKAKAIRLLEYERHRDSTLKTRDAIETALDRLCRDRGGIKRPAPSASNNGTSPGWSSTSSGGAPSRKSGPPDVSIRMALSVLLACGVVVGFIKIASKSLQPPVLPSAKSKVSVPPVSTLQSPVIRETIPVPPVPPQRYTPEPQYSSAVFKCTVNGKTVYSDSACGTPVLTKRLMLSDTSGGFASPPRERLEDLTANRLASEQAYQRSIQARAAEIEGNAKKAECEDLGRRINWLDASARAPQSGQMQDWIRADKMRTQTRQFDLHC